MEKENNVWMDESEIIHVTIPEITSAEEILEIFGEIEKNLKKTSNKAKVLVNMKVAKVIYSATFRQKLAEKIKALNEEPGYEKVAIFGTSSANKMITSVVLKVSGVTNIKLFDFENDALAWLKL